MADQGDRADFEVPPQYRPFTASVRSDRLIVGRELARSEAPASGRPTATRAALQRVLPRRRFKRISRLAKARCVDTWVQARLIRRVRFFRPIIALVLLAVWLPATLHCGVEAAGFALGSPCCADSDSDHAPASEASCETDGCGVVESGFRSSPSLSVPAPVALLSASPIWTLSLVPALAPLSPPVTGVVEARTAPPEINHSWVFVTRAAPLPGAPALA
jgi:hypothetical protein